MADLIAIGYKAVEARRRYRGTALKTSLSKAGERDRQEARHGQHAAAH
jgi:hypothetical protein